MRCPTLIRDLKTSNIGTVEYGPGNDRFYGINIVQNDDLTCTIISDDKFQALEPCRLTGIRRREIDSPLTAAENCSYIFLNSSLGFLGISVSQFCAF